MGADASAARCCSAVGVASTTDPATAPVGCDGTRHRFSLQAARTSPLGPTRTKEKRARKQSRHHTRALHRLTHWRHRQTRRPWRGRATGCGQHLRGCGVSGPRSMRVGGGSRHVKRRRPVSLSHATSASGNEHHHHPIHPGRTPSPEAIGTPAARCRERSGGGPRRGREELWIPGGQEGRGAPSWELEAFKNAGGCWCTMSTSALHARLNWAKLH